MSAAIAACSGTGEGADSSVGSGLSAGAAAGTDPSAGSGLSAAVNEGAAIGAGATVATAEDASPDAKAGSSMRARRAEIALAAAFSPSASREIMQCADIVSRNSRSIALLEEYARSSISNETDSLPNEKQKPAAEWASQNSFRLANFAAATPARRPKTSAFALARPPILSAPCMPPVHSPAANRPGTPHEPCSSIAMPPFEACAYGAMRAGALAETPHSRSSHPENARTNSGEPSPTSHAISMPSSPHASMAKSSGAPARSHENGPCSLRASRTSRAIGSPDASQARANRNAFSLNTMLRRGATSPGMICMNSKFTKRAPQRAAIA